MTTASATRGMKLYGGLLIGGSVLTILVSACSASAPAGAVGGPPTPATGTQVQGQGAASTAATQTSEGGQVTVAVTWRGPAAGPVFNIALDTHSVDLDAIDLSQAAVLRTNEGTEIRPSGWDAPKGGHHRSGTLTFPTRATDGSDVLGPSTTSLELVIRDVGGVGTRSFRWTP